MKQKKPLLKLTVGAAYLAFNIPTEDGEFSTAYEDVIKSPVVKSIGTTENAENATVRASGIDYKTISQASTIEIAMDVVAFDPEDVARLRAEYQDASGLIQSGRSADRPYVAIGFPVKKADGGMRLVWFPKTQLIENTDDIATSEESFSEQNDTLTFRCYAHNTEGDIKNYVDSETKNFPEGLTEDLFFAKPILTPADLIAATKEGA